VVLALALVGFLLMLAVSQSRPGPRLSRKAELVDLIQIQDERTAALRKELAALAARLVRLEGGASSRAAELAEVRGGVDELAPFGGLAAIRGKGIRVELTDSSLRESPTGDPNDLVIHQQDLQAVVNALWAGGAEGLAINGERITGFSAVRCVGNTLLLHGSVYSPPYRIAAVGDPARLRAALGRDDLVERFRLVAERFRLGLSVSDASAVTLPAFRGIAATRFAEVVA
jgi:uncharacterized protein YlxW (UPF0749 family)